MASKHGAGLVLEQKQQLTHKLLMELVPYLEMNRNEIEENVRRELDDNPALDTNEENTQEEEHNDNNSSLDGNNDDNDVWGNDDEDPSPGYRGSNRSADDSYYTPTAVSEKSLSDYLKEQVNEYELSDAEQAITEYIIGNLDDNGYLQRLTSAIADDVTFKSGYVVETKDVERVLEIIQQLDPPGIGARSIQECILIQLRRKKPTELVKLALEVVSNHFNDLGKHHYDKICGALYIDNQRFNDILKEIRKLDPKPGNAFSGDNKSALLEQITPDFEIIVDGDNITLTLINRIPELQISESYKKVEDSTGDKRKRSASEKIELADIKKKRDKATNYINLLKMRQERLYRTMKAIVDRQHDYFLTGDEADLKPMVLMDIAGDTGYDVSTISRSTQNKYVSTPWGIKSLKHFFTEGLSRDDGSEVSTHEVLNALKALVDEEDKRKPLTDEQLNKMLTDKGYQIARRTISKYRDRLNIPVARMRKQL